MTESLYTPVEVKKFKEQQIAIQRGIDPILGTAFPKGTICQDHSHESQHCRGALHLQTNAWEGKVINAYIRCLKWLTDVPLPDLLRNLASYLEKDYSGNPYHTGWQKRVKADFNKLSSKQMKDVLEHFGKKDGKNAVERKKIFNELVLDRSLGYDKIKDVISKAQGD